MSEHLYRVQINDVSHSLDNGKVRTVMLILRLLTLALVVSLLTMHVRSLRVFRWEQSVTGGLLVTYCLGVLGLAICSGTDNCGGEAFQVYICGSGAALFAINSAMLWRRWQRAGELTRIVAELLVTLGLQLKRQLRWKIAMSAVVAVLLLLDMALNPLLPHGTQLRLLISSNIRNTFDTNSTVDVPRIGAPSFSYKQNHLRKKKPEFTTHHVKDASHLSKAIYLPKSVPLGKKKPVITTHHVTDASIKSYTNPFL